MIEYRCVCGAVFELENISPRPVRCPECLSWDAHPLDNTEDALEYR